jgi:bifunctional DNA-binding transcriptional regulator/antitoxin component of YhaV-PrlF toxin-antitoxin module
MSLRSTQLSLSAKGEVTLPEALLRELEMKSGTKMLATVRGNRLIIQPLNATYFASLRGMLGHTEFTIEVVREGKAEERALEEAKLRRNTEPR